MSESIERDAEQIIADLIDAAAQAATIAQTAAQGFNMRSEPCIVSEPVHVLQGIANILNNAIGIAVRARDPVSNPERDGESQYTDARRAPDGGGERS